MSDYEYQGSELETFALATNWKAYFRSRIQQYIGEAVVEVGAGFGGTTRLLCANGSRTVRWVCAEPDSRMVEQLREAIRSGCLPSICQAITGGLREIPRGDGFDTILYIDVLEHIEDDAAEMRAAAGHLKAGGMLVILAPAHQWLFTRFDDAVGHYRRYTRKMLASLAPSSLRQERLEYLDSVGLLASLGNRILLKHSMPTSGQITLWDKVMIPCSRVLDPVLLRSLGKSVLGVWRKV
jgi:SAM-dependent methyltransferase